MAKNIITIPATVDRFTASPIGGEKKRKVAAYARVSTDRDEQLTSYEAQVDYYTNYIKGREDWEFVAVYADEGITGCNTTRRNGFNSMVEDALEGRIDLIITKSVSRFARNTVDSLSTIRKLKENGCECYFVFKKMFDQFVKSGEEKFKDFAEDQIEKYSKSEGSGEEHGLSGEPRACLIKEPEFFKYIRSYCRIWYYKGPGESVGSLYLLPNSNRGRYINYKLYAVYSYSSKIKKFDNKVTFHAGSSKDKESITVNGKIYSLNSSGEFTEGENNKAICIEGADQHILSVEDMIKFIGLRPKP